MTPLTERYALYLLIASIMILLVAVRWLTWHYSDLYARKVDALCKANEACVDVDFMEEYVHTQDRGNGVYGLTLRPIPEHHIEVYLDGLRLMEDADFTLQQEANTITIRPEAFRSAFRRKERADGGATIMRVLVGYWVLFEHKHKVRMKVQASDNAQTVTGVDMASEADRTVAFTLKAGGILHNQEHVKAVLSKSMEHPDIQPVAPVYLAR